MPLRLVLRADLVAEGLLLGLGPVLAAALHAFAPDDREHRRRLLAAHDGDARIGPAPQEAAAVGAPAHRVVAGPERAADHDRELRHGRAGHGGHHLRAVARDAAGLVLATHHEAGDVLQEQQRHAPAVAELHEVRALQRRLREQHAVVGDDPDRVSADAREAAGERRAVERLELVELGGVHEPRDHLADVVRMPRVARHDAVERLRRHRAARARRAGGGRDPVRLSLVTSLRAIHSACASLSAR